MVWLARTGAPWRDLPACHGSWNTVASRFYGCRRDGVFDRLLVEPAAECGRLGERDAVSGGGAIESGGSDSVRILGRDADADGLGLGHRPAPGRRPLIEGVVVAKT